MGEPGCSNILVRTPKCSFNITLFELLDFDGGKKWTDNKIRPN